MPFHLSLRSRSRATTVSSTDSMISGSSATHTIKIKGYRKLGSSRDNASQEALLPHDTADVRDMYDDDAQPLDPFADSFGVTGAGGEGAGLLGLGERASGEEECLLSVEESQQSQEDSGMKGWSNMAMGRSRESSPGQSSVEETEACLGGRRGRDRKQKMEAAGRWLGKW